MFLAQGAAVDLSTLIAATGQSVADTAAVVSAHAATIASTTTLGHVKVDGTTIVIDPFDLARGIELQVFGALEELSQE